MEQGKKLEIWKEIISSCEDKDPSHSYRLFSETIDSLLEKNKDTIFIKHIQSHLEEGQVAICKICGKSAEEIISDALLENHSRQGLKEQSKVEKPIPITPSVEEKEIVDSSAFEHGDVHNATHLPADTLSERQFRSKFGTRKK